MYRNVRPYYCNSDLSSLVGLLSQSRRFHCSSNIDLNYLLINPVYILSLF